MITSINSKKRYYLLPYTIFSVFLVFLFLAPPLLLSKELDIYGLNLSNIDFKTYTLEDIRSSLSSDPLLKDLVCPPITGLNLEGRKSHSIAIKSIQAKSNQATNKMVWTINLREDLFFMDSSSSIKADDFITFLDRNLKDIIIQKTLSTTFPKFSFNKISDYKLEILWETSPNFGPFILNNISIKNKKDCASFIKIQKNTTLSSIDLISRSNPNNLIHLHTTDISSKPKNNTSTLIIKYPSNYAANPTTRFSDEKIQCSTTLELPLFTVIIWNTHIKLMDDTSLRIALTQSIPRGELLRAALGSLGSLVSFPILRSHPGYNQSSSLRDFDLQKSINSFNSLGYLQNSPSTWRMDKNNKRIELNIFDPNGNKNLEKIIYDTSLFIGIKTNFIKDQKNFDVNKYHGYLFTYFIDNDFNYMNYLHSKSESYSKDQNPFFIINNKNDVLNIDKDLERYNLSLTREKPDFSLLKTIQDKMYSKELITTLLQTNLCLEGNIKFKNRIISPYTLNQYLTNFLKLNNKSI